MNERSSRSTDTSLKFAPGSLTASTEARRYHARFVKAGQILNADRTPANIAILPAAIQDAVNQNKFDGKAVFIDHAAWFASPSLNSLVGVVEDAFFYDNSAEGSIRLLDTQSGRLASELLDDLLSNPNSAPDVGLSMVFYPVWESTNASDAPGGSETRQITGIRYVESVDLVFAPAADGRILQALSSHQLNHGLSRTLSLFNPLSSAPFAESKSVAQERNNPMTETLSPPVTHPVPAEPVIPPSATQLTLDSWVGAAASAASAQILTASGLPQPSQDRLAQQHFENPDLLHQAIDAEKAYLASLSESNVIQIGGVPPRSPQFSGMLTSLDRIQTALEAMLIGARPPGNIQPLTGIRELYHLLSGDYEMSGVFHPDRIQFANVNCSTMAGMVANALNKVVANEFMEYPRWWEPITIPMDFSTLQQVKWITLGGVGELPTVIEGAAYTELNWDDQTETATFYKKGGYLGITLEAIDKDDTRRLLAAPRALAQAAWLTLAKAVSDIFISNSGVGPTMSDSLALFHSTHANLGSTALSVTTWAAARLGMRKMTEVNSGERLGALTAPRFLLVPPDLEITALQILGSETDYTYALSNGTGPGPINAFTEGADAVARFRYARERVIVIDLWTDTNNWAAVADPRLWPTIGIGYRYGRAPEVFSVASPTAGLMFTNDTMPVKVRFFFATGPIDYRGLYKANVS